MVSMYGKLIRKLRSFTNTTANKEPKWRQRGPRLTTGYLPNTYGPR
jgi:hydrogenase small subunit